MSTKNEVTEKKEEGKIDDTSDVQSIDTEESSKTCFVIMPISDPPGYEIGHFARVYNYIIKPACKLAGFVPIRADEVSGTNMIVIDILQKIVKSDMAVCDLSSRNPNVLYELGIRQSFDLPVTLIKDDSTDRIFDIQGFRDVFYEKSLRIDSVNEAVGKLVKSIEDTYNNKGKEVNSIIELMGITKATVKDTVKISSETEILLNAIKEITARLPLASYTTGVNQHASATPVDPKISGIETTLSARLQDDNIVVVGDPILHEQFGEGTVMGFLNLNGKKAIKIKFDSKGGVLNIIANSANLKTHPNWLPF